MPIVTTILFTLAIVALLSWKLGLKFLAIFSAAFLLGSISYFCVGIFIPRILGSGRFYSVPFGGFRIGSQDWALVLSVFSWVFVWSFVLYAVHKNMRHNSKYESR
jgi:hypothetical protein